ncbi:Phosphomevalonate kinase [Scheffersomyces coipomensis]|uniref:Phosphomevalonate kinase n=1 Tax=Scheffersomyces coipomensis TaxID=1788519 RepID=UPI00315D0BA8
MGQSRAFSAPGKALIAGGYLVLDPIYNSYVTALSSRMHSIVESDITTSTNGRRIKISSPQFKQGEWEYIIDGDKYFKDLKEINGRKNPFIEATIATILSYIQPKHNFNINITIYSDAGYHSQENTVSEVSSNGHKQFLYHEKAINEVAKTGLGSSAGLVTVLTIALLSYFEPQFNTNTSKHIVHNCAQIAHCYAQKKIGSGFDVAAAVYGSIIYKRFQPSLIEPFLTGDNVNNIDELKSLIESEWDFNHDQCTLPPKIRLLMGDIEGGSETPKLVSKILNWKREKLEESDLLYHNLNASNENLIKVLHDLHQFYNQDPEKYITEINQSHTSSSSPQFKALSDAINQIRLNLQSLTKLSGADVEPESQTELLDNCNLLAGSFGGVVPGAGGYDAICLLVIDQYIEDIIKETKHDEKFKNVTWLNLHEEEEGVKQENVEDYIGL